MCIIARLIVSTYAAGCRAEVRSAYSVQYACDKARGEHLGHDEAGGRGQVQRSDGGGSSMYIDLTQALARLDHRSDRLTVQLLPHCSSSEANVSNIRPRRVEVVIL